MLDDELLSFYRRDKTVLPQEERNHSGVEHSAGMHLLFLDVCTASCFDIIDVRTVPLNIAALGLRVHACRKTSWEIHRLQMSFALHLTAPQEKAAG
jgi:predicted class III extradiol MEMO1 family dioxygenase